VFFFFYVNDSCFCAIFFCKNDVCLEETLLWGFFSSHDNFLLKGTDCALFSVCVCANNQQEFVIIYIYSLHKMCCHV